MGEETTENKTTVDRYMDGFRKSDHARILSCLADDVEWDMPGVFHLTGKEAFDREIENEAFVGRPAIHITRMTEENDVVIAEGSVRTQRRNGTFLEARFCDVFAMQGGKIRRLTTYQMESDTEAKGNAMQKITPFLWFDDNAEEAANFYASIFDNSRIVNVTRYSEAAAHASGRPEGTVMTVAFELEGQEFIALNGGPHFKFSPAISFVVNCGTQEELDELWEKLSAGGEPGQCGWLTDKYGMSWQLVPEVVVEMLQDQDPEKVARVMKAVITMTKLDMDALEKAYRQG